MQRGDTLYSIAFRNQIDYHDLASWNGVGRDYAISPGRVLRLTPPEGELPLPVTGLPAVPAPAPAAALPRAPASAATSAAAVAAREPAAAPPPSSPHTLAEPPPEDSLAAAPVAGHWLWPTRGSVARRFGVEGSKGLDLAGTTGQVVVSTAAGKVVYSGSALKGYGELIIVKHDEQYLSAYGYNRRRLVEEGQQVEAGQPIAEMGLGPEQQPILHFEIRDKGRPIDPQGLLPRM